MTAKIDLPAVPPALADVSLIDGPTCASAGGMSISSWHEAVRVGSAPQPVLRQPRCTRWRLADVRAWLIERAANKQAPAEVSRVVALATKASRAAKAKRTGGAPHDDPSGS